ncbi:MAG: alpha/beta hydrolase [Polyangiaceae bacterium]
MRLIRSVIVGTSLLAGCALPKERPPAPPPVAKAAVPPAKGPVLPAEEVPLAFDRGPFHLEGTLTLPARTAGAKVPVAVLVHGSGPMSRDGVMRGQIGLGFGFDLPVYKQLAEALGERGYAVYRYDKRSCNGWNGCKDDDSERLPYAMLVTELSTGELVRDAEAALDRVSEYSEIDPERTFFIGHSEGGELVPLLLADRPAARAGVMLAPPFHTMGVVLHQQSERLRWALLAAGEPDRAEAEGSALEHAAVALRQIEDGTYLGAPVLGQPAGLWASWIGLAKKIPDVARGLHRPLLVVGGSYDYNVPPSEIESWGRWLSEGSAAPHRVRVIAGMTHALNCIAEPDPTRIKPADIDHRVSPDLVDEVSRFLDSASGQAR